MTRQSRVGLTTLGAVLVGGAALAASVLAGKELRSAACPPLATTSAATPRSDCCFTNPAYSGTCVVSPEKDETCATILSYLNDPQSQGKTYCHDTSLRGGWAEVACSPAPALAPGTASAAPPSGR